MIPLAYTVYEVEDTVTHVTAKLSQPPLCDTKKPVQLKKSNPRAVYTGCPSCSDRWKKFLFDSQLVRHNAQLN